jgi:signal transduction histidine kinase
VRAATAASARLPAWMRSVRFRFTLLYSSVLFALAALLVGALYLSLSLSLRDEPVSRDTAVLRVVEEQGGELRSREVVLNPAAFEREVNQHTLASLRNFSFGALGALFAASLGVGWVIAGRVVAPIERISAVARDIQATNLSRRIELDGPDDELKRLADTFDEMLGRLDASFTAQRRFVADASHELRNPLAVIQTNVDVALADPKASPERLRRAALVVRRASRRMSRLVDDLLALARLEAPATGALATRREQVDLARLVRDVGEEYAAPILERGVELDRTAPAGVTARGDPETLKRALANLLDNAVRIAPPGSRVRLAAGRRDGWAWLAVADEGPGIPREQQARVFDRFYRVDEGRSRARGGSGLGLAIVREITEAHGGEVRLFSQPGAGSTFVLWLPLTRATRPVPAGDPIETVDRP